jgi:hypothetical protein
MEYEEGFCCQVTSSCIVFFYVEEEHEVRKSFFRLFTAFLFWGVGFFGFCCFCPLEDWVMNTAVG